MTRSLSLSTIIISSLLLFAATPLISSGNETASASSFAKALTYITETIQQHKAVSGALSLAPAALFYLCSSNSDKVGISLGLAFIGFICWAGHLTQPEATDAITTHPAPIDNLHEKPWYTRDTHTKQEPTPVATQQPVATQEVPTGSEKVPFAKRMENHFVNTMDQFS